MRMCCVMATLPFLYMFTRLLFKTLHRHMILVIHTTCVYIYNLRFSIPKWVRTSRIAKTQPIKKNLLLQLVKAIAARSCKRINIHIITHYTSYIHYGLYASLPLFSLPLIGVITFPSMHMVEKYVLNLFMYKCNAWIECYVHICCFRCNCVGFRINIERYEAAKKLIITTIATNWHWKFMLGNIWQPCLNSNTIQGVKKHITMMKWPEYRHRISL